MTEHYSISFNNLTFIRNNEVILNNISGAFQSRKITALIGPSGSGKTTLLKMLNGLLSPTSGDIFILDTPIHNYVPTQLRSIVGMALQDAPIIRGTVYENLALPFTLKGKKLSKEKATQFLHYVGLNDNLLSRDANDLSGGQRQRLSLARTLLNEPKILLLDEITSALDPKAAGEIEELIKKITYETGVTTIWITHNSKQAMSLSDNLLLMHKGEIALSGVTELIKEQTPTILSQFLNGGELS